MINASLSTEKEFRPQYTPSWYVTVGFALVISVMYIRSKIIGESMESVIEFIGIGAIFMTIYSISHTVKKIEFGSGVTVKYVLWPSRRFSYKSILALRLPEIVIDSQPNLKMENMSNLEELQQEFRTLEFLGVIRKGCVRELEPATSKFTSKPKIGSIILGLVSALYFGNELFQLSKGVNILWFAVLAILFASEVLGRLFGKRKDE